MLFEIEEKKKSFYLPEGFFFREMALVIVFLPHSAIPYKLHANIGSVFARQGRAVCHAGV